MSFYDENPELVELHKKTFLMLLDRMGRDQAASLYAGTKMAVDGLTKNNETFVAAYHVLLDKERENDQAIESTRRETFEKTKAFFLQLSYFSDDDISEFVEGMKKATYEDFSAPDDADLEDDERVTQ